MGFSSESLSVAIGALVLRRVLKVHLNSSREDALTDEQCPPWAQREKVEAGCRTTVTTACPPTSQLQMDRLGRREESGLAQNHEAGSGTGRTGVQKLPQHKLLTGMETGNTPSLPGVPKHSDHLPLLGG